MLLEVKLFRTVFDNNHLVPFAAFLLLVGYLAVLFAFFSTATGKKEIAVGGSDNLCKEPPIRALSVQENENDYPA